MIGGELIAVNGTKIKAGNNKKMNFSRKKLDARLEHIDEQIKEYLSGIEENDRNEERPYRTVTRSQYSKEIQGDGSLVSLSLDNFRMIC